MVDQPTEQQHFSRVRCESDAWPFAIDMGLFEARRAVRPNGKDKPHALWLLPSDKHPDPPLRMYLRTAKLPLQNHPGGDGRFGS